MKCKRLYTLPLFVLIFCLHAFSQPTGVLTNTSESRFCQKGSSQFKVAFTGTPKFGYIIKLYDAFDNAFLYDISNTSDGVTQNEITLTEPLPLKRISNTSGLEVNIDSIDIVLERVFDNTILQGDNGWTATSVALISNQSIRVYIDHYSKVKLPDDNSTYCGLSYSFSQELQSPNNHCLWKADPQTGSFSSNTDPKATFTTTTEGNYTITYTEINGACADSSDVMEITFFDNPTASIPNNNLDICSTDKVPVEITLEGHAPFNITFKSGNSFTNSFVTPNNNETYLVNVNGGDNITINSVVDVNGCSSYNLQGEISTTDIKPTPDAGNDQTVCGPDVTLNASNPVGTAFWTVSGNGYFNDYTQADATFSVENTYGEYIFTWHDQLKDFKGNTCESTDEAQITFDKIPEVINAGEDLNLYLSDAFNLSAVTPDAGSGIWTLINGSGTIIEENNASSEVQNMEQGTSTFRWTVKNGTCPEASDEVSIFVKGLESPTGFSPNGDGINDLFIIGGDAQINDNHLTIFDKNGKVVFEQKNYGHDGNERWSGNDVDGKPLLTGVYYYVFTGKNSENEEITPIKEFIVLKRQ